VAQSGVVRFSSPLVSGQVRAATYPWRVLVGRVLALATTLACGFLLAAQSARGSTFTINDLPGNGPGGTDIITVTADSLQAAARVAQIPCSVVTLPPRLVGVEQNCEINITAPVTLPLPVTTGVFVGPTPGTGAPIGLTGDGTLLSDEFDFTSVSSAALPVANTEFDSCADELSIVAGPCTPFPTCAAILLARGTCVQENGAPGVLLGSILWENITGGTTTVVATDQIFARSDVETPTVPEPSSLILLGSGLLMAGGFLRRRLVTP